MVVHAYNPKEAEVGDLHVLEYTVGYIVRPCLKKNKDAKTTTSVLLTELSRYNYTIHV